MNGRAIVSVNEPRGHLEHPALLYTGRESFLNVMVPYVESGIENDEFVFVAARADNLVALREGLGQGGAPVRWEDTAEWHAHPGTRLRAFYEMAVEQRARGAQRLRLVGEPVWPDGPPELVREWQRYESSLNAVLAPFPATLLCLYDAAALDRSIVETAYRTHPVVDLDGSRHASGVFMEPDDFLRRWRHQLATPPPWAAAVAAFEDLCRFRRFVMKEAFLAGLDRERAMDLTAAANEVVGNVFLHADGAPSVWTWSEGGRFFCQIADRGPGIADPLAGYRPPVEGDSGRGLWMARQLADLINIVATDQGTTVRLEMARPQ